MCDHDLVRDGDDDDAGHDRDVQVGVGVAREPAAVISPRQEPLRAPSDLVEVQPPQRRRRRERHHQRCPVREIQHQRRCGGAGDDDRLAQRDDDEELEPLREVRRLDLPVGGRRAAQPGRPVANGRRHVVDCQRRDPQPGAGARRREPAGQPQHARDQAPGQDPPKDDVEGVVARCRVDVEGVPRHLQQDVGAGEQRREPAEGLGDGDRHQQAGCHHHQQHQPHQHRLGIEPVGHPGGVDPGPPHDQQQEQRLQGAAQRQVMKQQVAELRHREHEDQVEEQLQPGRPLLLAGVLAEVT